jgi:hypothetical protein
MWRITVIMSWVLLLFRIKKILKKYDSSELIEKIKSYKKFSRNNPLKWKNSLNKE